MTTKVWVIFGSLLVAVLLVGFQNCSGARFSSMDDSSVNKLGDGLDDHNFPEGEVVKEDDPDKDVIDPTEEQEQEDDETVLDASCDTSTLASDMGGQDVNIRRRRGSLSLSDVGHLNLRNIRGATYVEANSAGTLTNMRGALCLISTNTAGGSGLDVLNNHRGAVKIVGFDSTGNTSRGGDIVNTRGVLILDNSNIGVVKNHRGKIVLLNGATINSIVNHRGPIVDGAGSDVSSSIPNQQNVRLGWR